MVTSRILGPDGEPIRMADLAEPQTSQLQALQHEWQGHPTRGLTPSKLAAILDAAEQGDIVAQSDLYEDMEEKDAHVAAEMGKRRRAVSMLDWEIVPPPSPYAREKRDAKQLREWISEIPDLDVMLYDVTDAIGKGFCCLEIEWHRIEGVWLPKTVTHRPQSWFRLVRCYREEIRLRTGGSEGEPLQPFGWITHTHGAKSGWLSRAALFRVLAWPYLFKNYSVADLAEFLEIYGLPLRVGKYPPGAGEKEKVTLLRALTGLGHKAAGIIPEGMMIEFERATDGKPDAYQCMIDWCERSQSKAILGGTLTSQADGKTSTNALGEIHEEVRKDLRDADAKQVASTLSRDLVYAIAALNGLAPNGVRRAPRWHFPTEETEDLETYATALPPLVNMGLRIPRKWAQERLGIPEPESDDDDLLGSPQAATLEEAADGPRTANTALRREIRAVLAAERGGPEHDPDPPDRQAGRLDTEIAPATDAWIDEIRALVDRAESLEQIRDALVELMPDMSLDEYTRAMRQALAAAALAGRYEVLREAGSV